MPKRRRTQRIEEESRRAFGDALEERFLLRDDVPDFGIDGSVEEFDPGDRATGLRWFVQLKATDEEELGEALRRSVPIEHADFYNSLSLPLLMVRYLAAPDQLYVRWWHSPLPATRKGRADAASVTFRWSEDDLFETADSTRLAEEAHGFLELRSTDLPLPFFLGVVVEEPAAGLSGADVELSIKAAAEERPDVVEVRRDVVGGRILLAADRIAIELAGVVVASMVSGTADQSDESGRLGIDAMALLATGFARWGQHEVAARLTQTFFARSSLHGDPDAAILLAGSMTRARRLTEALAVAAEIDELSTGAAENTSVIFTLTPRRHGSLRDAEKEEYVQTMRGRIERRVDAGEEVAASREALSLGNFFRNEHRGAEALALYRQAAELDPEYLERLHYWHEIAGVLFLSGRWEESASAYAKALELGGDAWSAILEADALMFAGPLWRGPGYLRRDPARDREHRTGWGVPAEGLPAGSTCARTRSERPGQGHRRLRRADRPHLRGCRRPRPPGRDRGMQGGDPERRAECVRLVEPRRRGGEAGGLGGRRDALRLRRALPPRGSRTLGLRGHPPAARR